jgi:hypothetical protein
VKLVHLVGFIIKKSVTMHGNTNPKNMHTFTVFSEIRILHKQRNGVFIHVNVRDQIVDWPRHLKRRVI